MFLKYIMLCSFSCLCLLMHAQEVIPLYTGLPPGSLPVENRESVTKSAAGSGRTFVNNVTVPTITVFLPSTMKPGQTAIVICPGGGYSRLSIEDGGYEAARVLAQAGIVGIVLKYRTWVDSAYTHFREVPFMDVKRAFEIVYDQASAWQIDTSKIGIMGFSAGGHLAATASTQMNTHRPAFSILLYPVISFMDSLTSGKSSTRSTLLGGEGTEAEKLANSPELHMTNQTPPAYLVHARDDKTALYGNSVAYYKGLIKLGIPAELVLYNTGGHGFALYNEMEDANWMPGALSWLKKMGFFGIPGIRE